MRMHLIQEVVLTTLLGALMQVPTATNSAGAGNSPTSGSVMIDGVSSSAALGGNVEAKKCLSTLTLNFQ